ncbi:MAG: sugar ABC transporter substrate-binding protein [Herpetosiphonaceae bacterium]|nr:sugar ABC transporter substrate-binding protein [Herpetosiphonaceae bacterium]
MSAPRRWFKFVAASVLLSVLFAACGSTATPAVTSNATTTSAPAAIAATAAPAAAIATTSAPAAAITTAAPAAVTTAPAAAATTQEPITLTVWAEGNTVTTMDSAPDTKGKLGKFLIQQFEKEHPGVTVVLQDQGWDEVLRQNLTNALLAGTAPDVIVGENFFQQFAAQGALVPLDDVIGDIKPNLIPGTIQAATYNGKTYGISAMTGVFGFERNCKVVTDAGLNCDNPPKTWDELLSQAKTLTDKGAGNYYGYTLQGPVGFSVGGIFRVAVYMAQSDAPMCKDNCTTPFFNNPKAIPVLEFLRKINKFTPPGLTFNADEGQVYTQLFQNKSAYQIAGSWHTAWAKENKCPDCRYSPIPIPAGGHDASVIVGNVIYTVLKQSKHPAMAAEWVKFLARDGVQDLVYPALGRLPATRSALTKLRPSVSTADQAFIDVLLNSKDLQVLPQWQKNPQLLWTAYNDMLTKLLTTDTPVQQLVDEAQKAAEAALK